MPKKKHTPATAFRFDDTTLERLDRLVEIWSDKLETPLNRASYMRNLIAREFVRVTEAIEKAKI